MKRRRRPLIASLGSGIFKFDYNINIGVGTRDRGGQPGRRAAGAQPGLLAWLDGISRGIPICHRELLVRRAAVDYASCPAQHPVHERQTDPLLYCGRGAARAR